MKYFSLSFIILNCFSVIFAALPVQINPGSGTRTLILPKSSSGKIKHGFDSYITVHASATEKIKPNHEEYRLSINIEEAKLADCLLKFDKLEKGILDMFKQIKYNEKYYRFSAPFFKKHFIEDPNGKKFQKGYFLAADLFIETPPGIRVKNILIRLLANEAITLKTVVQSSTAYEKTKETVLKAALLKAKERADVIAKTFKLDLDEVQLVEETASSSTDKLILNADENFGFPVGTIEVSTDIKVTFEVH